jgi:predicted dehydrogenase
MAVAARDRAKADAFARKHKVPRVHDSYEALLGDPDVEAVYVPLPNGLHGRWTLAALAAGKHVLCEKPFTANADEAREVAGAAAGAGLVVMEAFHWRYHPLADRMLAIVAGGELGAVRHVEASFCFPLPRRSDIRWQLDLAGGSLMDAGCYAVHMVRTLAAREPVVRRARARVRMPAVDRWIQADLEIPGGATGKVTAAMWSATVLCLNATVVGTEATMSVLNPLAPQFFHRLTVKGRNGKRTERVRGRSTYAYQLEAFASAVRHGSPVLTGPDDSVANMTLIDAIYRAAGLDPRTPTYSGP